MGLDMIPMGKPKPGFEKRFNEIINILEGKRTQQISIWEKLKGKRLLTREEILKEWKNIQTPSYETIKAPRVGRDLEADNWLKEKYNQSDRSISEEEFIKAYNGYYVIELAKEKDGVPVYCSLDSDSNVFRGQFLAGCVDILGEPLVAEAWTTKLAEEALEYGHRLCGAVETIATAKNVEYLKSQRLPPEGVAEESLESKVHIAYSLAKWLIFYGKNGHGYEAYF